MTPSYRRTQRRRLIYLFGSFGTEFERSDSDADIALLLPHEIAKELGDLLMDPLQAKLTLLLGMEVDLVNLRHVDTILQKEVIHTGRRIFIASSIAADVFAMYVLRSYQLLNAERKQIVENAIQTGRFIR